MKKEYESNIILKNDNGESLRIARNLEEECYTIGTDEEVFFNFSHDELSDLKDALDEVVLGRKDG